ncbi:MAG: ATP synthase subunit I [Acetatifactor sp.]|nr:ATP synthase subunit I [Acetatifactor sp.]
MADATHIDISRLENKIDSLSKQTDSLKGEISGIRGSVTQVRDEIQVLRQDFERLMNEQKKNATLQRATTEIVRIRQEIEQNFGNYKVIRETMLGVLQATDLALVKKTTISTVSEQLMLSTPKYWLAPCLVAVSAWIGNDKDLAERAIAEAVKRDEERTALTMALICRRNNRVQTCYEWLSIYFRNQNAADFSEGSLVYVDAYVNGVFGPDEHHMCDDYITQWLSELKGSDSLYDRNQEELWKKYCDKFTCDLGTVYPDLKDTVSEYGNIQSYVGRIRAVEPLSNNFNSMAHAHINQEKLKTTIDKNLIALISRYNEDEEPMRREEEYLQAIKEYDGDEAKAKAKIQALEQQRKKEALDLVQQMSRVIFGEDDVSVSEKKTAVSFLSNYINSGFKSYIKEHKESFPSSITMNVNGWTGQTTDGSNSAQLCTEYAQFLSDNCGQELEKAQTKAPLLWLIGAGITAVLAILAFFASPVLGVLVLLGAGACVLMSFLSKKKIARHMEEIKEKYQNMDTEGKNKIMACVAQWNDARNTVNQFDRNPVETLIA